MPFGALTIASAGRAGARRRARVAAAGRPTEKRCERSTGRLLSHESDSAEALAGRRESGDRQAPSRPHRRRPRRTRVRAKARLRAGGKPRPDPRRRGASRDWRQTGQRQLQRVGPASVVLGVRGRCAPDRSRGKPVVRRRRPCAITWSPLRSRDTRRLRDGSNRSASRLPRPPMGRNRWPLTGGRLRL